MTPSAALWRVSENRGPGCYRLGQFWKAHAGHSSRAPKRVPDICVISGEDLYEQIFTHAPFLCIEILSKDDRMKEMVERVNDYLTFGVRYVWVLDPQTRRAFVHDASGGHDLKDGMLWTLDPEILVPFGPLFD